MTANPRRGGQALGRDALQARVNDLFLSFFEQLHAGPAAHWLDLDLTMPQLKMLFVVDWLGPIPTSQLAARLGITVSTATGLIDRLVDAGLARREPDGRDRRIVRVGTTEAGRTLIIRLRSASGERLDRVLGHLSAEELRRCARALESISSAVAGLHTEQASPTAIAAGVAEAGR